MILHKLRMTFPYNNCKLKTIHVIGFFSGNKLSLLQIITREKTKKMLAYYKGHKLFKYLI